MCCASHVRAPSCVRTRSYPCVHVRMRCAYSVRGWFGHCGHARMCPLAAVPSSERDQRRRGRRTPGAMGSGAWGATTLAAETILAGQMSPTHPRRRPHGEHEARGGLRAIGAPAHISLVHSPLRIGIPAASLVAGHRHARPRIRLRAETAGFKYEVVSHVSQNRPSVQVPSSGCVCTHAVRGAVDAPRNYVCANNDGEPRVLCLDVPCAPRARVCVSCCVSLTLSVCVCDVFRRFLSFVTAPSGNPSVNRYC